MPNTFQPPDATPNDRPLPALPGIDPSVGLKSADGNVQLYCRLLTMFGEGQRNLRERVSAALEQRDLVTVSRLLHTLRGSAAGLGMASLADSASRLERGLKLGKGQAELSTQFEIVYLETELILHSLVQGGLLKRG